MGRFITFEGIEGCGKSTQASRLKAYLESQGQATVLTREPGGTPIGEAIRAILLNPEHSAMKPTAELLLYQAARAQHVEEVIQPALARGEFVICDRFVDSTLAYQGAGRQLSQEILSAALDERLIARCVPDRTILLDIDVETSRQRLGYGQSLDRIEQEAVDFHARVRDGFLEIARLAPQRVNVIDATRTIDEVESEIRKLVNGIIGS